MTTTTTRTRGSKGRRRRRSEKRRRSGRSGKPRREGGDEEEEDDAKEDDAEEDDAENWGNGQEEGTRRRGGQWRDRSRAGWLCSSPFFIFLNHWMYIRTNPRKASPSLGK